MDASFPHGQKISFDILIVTSYWELHEDGAGLIRFLWTSSFASMTIRCRSSGICEWRPKLVERSLLGFLMEHF